MKISLTRMRWSFTKDMTTQPLGLMYLASALRADQPHHEIDAGPPRPPILELDPLPHPAWDLVDIPAYWRE